MSPLPHIASRFSGEPASLFNTSSYRARASLGLPSLRSITACSLRAAHRNGPFCLTPDQIGQSPDPENVRPCWTLPTLPRRRGLFHQANYPESVAQSVQTVSVRSQNPGVGNKAQPTSFELPERTARLHVVRGSALRAQ